jgi:cytochrome c oxidase assembly protein subunit 11
MADQQKIDEKQKRLNRSNRTVAIACLSFFVCMSGAAYASVPRLGNSSRLSAK